MATLHRAGYVVSMLERGTGCIYYVSEGSLRDWPMWTPRLEDARYWQTRYAAKAWAKQLLRRSGVGIEKVA